MIILLDAGPLGMLTNPAATRKTREITDWMAAHLARGVKVRVPEVSDYEVRRNMILEGLTAALSRLDSLGGTIGYIPITTPTMRKAAELWADVRRRGVPTAPKEELDCDAVLAAQAIVTSADVEEILIATDNVGHLNRFETAMVKAKNWRDIT